MQVLEPDVGAEAVVVAVGTQEEQLVCKEVDVRVILVACTWLFINNQNIKNTDKKIITFIFNYLNNKISYILNHI